MNSNITLGEMAKIEELSGQPISDLGAEGKPQGNLMAAMACVFKQRDDRKFTMNQALALTFDELNDILGLDEEDPKED